MKRTITDEIIVNFRKYLYDEERSENTVIKYLHDLRRFNEWLQNRKLEKSVVIEYKKELCERYAPRSVNSMLSSINAFFAFMGWHDLRVKTLKIQRQIFVKVEDELTRSEYKRLLAVARKNGIRQYLLIQTICATGIRVSELKYITAEAVRKCRAEIHMKGKLRIVLLPDKLCKRLRKYAAEQKISGGSIFVTRNGKPVDRTYIWRLMKGLCEAAGVDKRKAFPHNLRHLFARTFYSLEKDIVRLADILGHSSVDTTRIYTRKAGKFAVPICGNWDICFVDEKFSSN